MKRTYSLLSPGIRLVRNLKFAEKFLLICLLLLIPLTYASYYLLEDVYQHAQDKQLEMTGLQYAIEVSTLLELIPQHRGMTNGLLQGDERFRAKIAAMQPELEKALKTADAADHRWGKELDLHATWLKIRDRWLDLHDRAQTMSAPDSWEQHTNLLADYLDLIFRVTVNTSLYTEATPAARHLIEVNFHYLPQLIEALGQLRGSGSGMLADGVVTDAEQREFTRLIANVSSLTHEIQHNMTFAFEKDRQLQEKFFDQTEQVSNQAYAYMLLAKTQIAHPDTSLSVPRYFDQGTETISTGYHLLRMTTEHLQREFDQEIRALNQQKYFLISSILTGILIISYLIAAFYGSLRNTTQKLKTVVEHLQRGEAPEQMVMPGRDELSSIILLFNQLSGQLIHSNIALQRSQHEDHLLGNLSLLALQHDNLEEYVKAALPVITAAADWLPCIPAGQINLRHEAGDYYVAATLNMEAIAPEHINHTADIHIKHMAEKHICCLPFMIAEKYVGELLLQVAHANLSPAKQTFLPQLADAVAIAIGRLTAETALKQREVELSRSNEELERFAYISSHDLQEPLRKICAFGDRLLKNAPLEGRDLDYLQRMIAAAGRMQELIEDLLTFSRVNASQRPFVETDLNLLLAEVCGTLELQIEESGAKITVGQLGSIDADRIQMAQLFQNLLGNALKYRRADTPPIIKIERDLSAGQENNMLYLICQDNGIGFEMQYAQQIFEAFKRLHGRAEYSGSGIGLAVCRRIVERHGGTIYATSEPGAGTCMHFSLRLTHKQRKNSGE